MITQFKATRRAAVPIVAIETADQQGTIAMIMSSFNGNPPRCMIWDLIRGLQPANAEAQKVVSKICGQDDPAIATGNPAEMLAKIVNVDSDNYVIFMINAHRVISNEAVSQGIANVREIFKSMGATLVLLAPIIALPEELKQDVIILSEPLPNATTLEDIVKNISKDAGMEEPKDIDKIVDTLIGLSSFAAEQTFATCINKYGDTMDVDRKMLWERKCKAIEQTPGLSIWRGGETFKDIGGCDNIKNFISNIIKGKDAPRAIVFMDEIEKAFAGSGSDTSGVSQDQLGAILSFMQDKEVDGMIFIGAPGAAKSAIAKAAGNEGNIPTISFDLGAMKNSLVGKSGEQTRNALKIIEAVSQGRALFIATCNSITVLPPELRRRFTMGTFYFDLPAKEERKIIWDIYLKKYGLEKVKEGRNSKQFAIPDDEGWTGAEIKQCSKLSSKLNISLVDAAKYIVPVSKSASDIIENLRRSASGKFIDAGKSGVYDSGFKKTESKRNFNISNN